MGRLVRLIPPANLPRREIVPRVLKPPANGEPLLWENLPNAQVSNELVCFFFCLNAAPPPQHGMGPFDVCNICLDRPADWGIDCSEHHFCGECVAQLSQVRVAIGFHLRKSVCPCRRDFLIAFPLQNTEHMENEWQVRTNCNKKRSLLSRALILNIILSGSH